mmetsp:Transcript_34466/g.97204  ORF Transcript_34466/g.97204 Transcript_34466/m.97204 type:complete len:187 (+) Transcript_34466:186-746(+)|eukprot:CAMPEP_0119131806 /NCGR_PEP_ID=MMETSP1310-20130426/10654_1 /TAXON_ID=464262 /ORGANISM="Genus nov. species nov., Strain RCC2339" /LENGTH=186 /DNA_ID=CAMNT_0007122399 /DNA_START=131 /DNA_END=691 /DNA_ORIENTATION=+
MASKNARLGEYTFNKVDKVNAEIFVLTYGTIVAQMLEDFDDVNETNKQLDRMGYRIGVRLIDEFLARSGIGRCKDLKETADNIAKVAFKMFLGITARIENWSADEKEFSVILDENPLLDYVELPPSIRTSLWYDNVICGVIRGALEMVQLSVDVAYLKSPLRGDDFCEVRVTFKEYIADEVPVGED